MVLVIKMKKKLGIIAVVIAVAIMAILGYVHYENVKEQERLALLQQQEQQLEEVKSHFSEKVQTQRVTLLFNKIEDKYVVAGSIGKDEVLSLVEQELTYDTEYFLCKEYDLYVKCQDVLPITEEITYSLRHKNYIPFNESVVLDKNTIFYDEDENLVLSLYTGMTLPILVKEDAYYGVDYQDRLLWIRKEDVKEVIKQENSTDKIATGIRVYCYHQLYDESKTSCNKIICHPLSQMHSHFKYIRDAGYYTMTMQDMQWYVAGKVNMPYKSVCLTFDDGGVNTKLVIKMLEEYDLHATLFLIAYKLKDYMISDHLELHSHTYNMHTYGHCSLSPRGSAILCKDKEEVLADLIKSREVLDGAYAFCYPYYEYNKSIIKTLKEAGFTMAFMGDEGLVHVGDDPFKISRYTFSNNSSVNELKYWMHRE